MDIEALLGRLDRRFTIDTLVDLARVPADVPMGHEVFIEPDDPKLVHYVQNVLRPKLAQAGAYDLIDVPGNQIVARHGAGTGGKSLLIQVYTPVQHHNLMDDPWSGKIASGAAWGRDEPCVFGMGVGQNKSHQAIALAVLKLLADTGTELPGTLYVAINNEGRSSHKCSEAILGALDAKPDFALLMTATHERISMGNRGRVDVNVTVRGKAVHSSVPDTGLSAIEGAWEVMSRLKRMTFEGTHPLLGGRHVLPYQIAYSPLAPHTIPDTARMRIDRRLLPGDDPAAAAEEVRAAIGDLSPWEVTVEQGHHMWPALVDPDNPVVRLLAEAHESVHGEPPGTFYGQGTFDAGGPCAAGVPAVMYGVAGGAGVLDTDLVALSCLDRVSRVVARTILSYLGE
ncbi:MAG: M20/M25/M40 family metallo-hydrolase [Defluviicoccus sp.]|nr:M20/M25/M40 family metallo-hydrolase [Defluviicoccus sp.]MDE0277561.1 M20/M25/M40 family metallo-hydrolase [Defluviicoccus sp.]